MANTSLQRAPRPWTLWALSALVMLIAAINAALAVDHVAHADAYRALGVSYPPLLRAALALIWAGVFGALALGLARRRRWARRWFLAALSNYAAFGVLWLMIYARADFDQGRVAFQAALSALLVALAAWVMHWRRIRRAFEPEPPRDLPHAETFEHNSGEMSA